jgi:hypothetical protein
MISALLSIHCFLFSRVLVFCRHLCFLHLSLCLVVHYRLIFYRLRHKLSCSPALRYYPHPSEVFFLCLVLCGVALSETQFRGGQISWSRTDQFSTNVTATVNAAWNVAGFPLGGGVVLNWGDGALALLSLLPSNIVSFQTDSTDGTQWFQAKWTGNFSIDHYNFQEDLT